MPDRERKIEITYPTAFASCGLGVRRSCARDDDSGADSGVVDQIPPPGRGGRQRGAVSTVMRISSTTSATRKKSEET